MTVKVDELRHYAEVMRRQASNERLNAAAARAVGGVCEVETCTVRLADARALEQAARVFESIAADAARSHLRVVR